MTILVPIMLFGWIILTIRLFASMSPQRAATISIIGGFLFLPMASYELPIIPIYSKTNAIAYSIILAVAISDSARKYLLRMCRYDIPMIAFCFIVPLATSLSNGLGLWDGISSTIGNYLGWGVFYWVGRRYFTEPISLRYLTRSILFGGLLYTPLIIYEVRMSPQLSNIFYGFFPHSFIQHIRYGSYRPIVFMQHGLMVALWMAACSTVAYWMWRSKSITRLGAIPIWLVCASLIVATLLCKSGNGIAFLLLGLGAYHAFANTRSTRLHRLLLVAVGLYLALRISNTIPVEDVIAFAERFFDIERIQSLAVRLRQEDLFGSKALLRPLFGWGGYNRGWPVDPMTGQLAVSFVDSLWVILFSTNGMFGLFSVFLALGTGPWLVFSANARMGKAVDGERQEPFAIDAIILSMIVAFFLIDALLNSMISPVYTMCSGALVTYYLERQKARGCSG